MLVLKFFIFATFMAGTSYCMSYECYTIRQLECPHYDISEEKPKVVEDLQNICTNIIPLGQCILKVLEKCAENDEFVYDHENEVEEFRKTVEFIESACDEDSPVFTALADNLLCVTSTLDTMDDICTWDGLNKTTEEKLINMVEGEESPHCVLHTWVFYCVTARFDVECGSDVKYALSEILDNTDYISPYCREMRKELSHFQEAFVSEFRQGRHGQAAVPGIMKAIAKEMN